MKIGDIFNAAVKNLPKKQTNKKKKTASSHKINKLIHNIPFIAVAGLLFFPFCHLLIVVVDAAASVRYTTSSLAMC